MLTRIEIQVPELFGFSAQPKELLKPLGACTFTWLDARRCHLNSLCVRDEICHRDKGGDEPKDASLMELRPQFKSRWFFIKSRLVFTLQCGLLVWNDCDSAPAP